MSEWEERFWKKVNKNGPRPSFKPSLGRCWIWKACRSVRGYGRFMHKKDGRQFCWFAHRLAWTARVGPIPDGMELDHKCRVHACVRPSHNRPVTHQQNMSADGSMVGVPSGLMKKAKTHCPQGHPYKGKNLMWYRHAGKEWRGCRECNRIRCAKRYTLRKQGL